MISFELLQNFKFYSGLIVQDINFVLQLCNNCKDHISKLFGRKSYKNRHSKILCIKHIKLN